MIIRIRLFARAKDLAGRDTVTVELPTSCTVGEVKERLAREHPSLSRLVERSALAVNDEFAEDTLTVPLGADVALLPPVSGG
jgi:molybdopterin converting factor subunit 1